MSDLSAHPRANLPEPISDAAVEATGRYHKRPFNGFAPKDEKRRKQIVSLPMDVLLSIFRERLEYLTAGSDLDAVAQNAACEIERALGVFPNLEGALTQDITSGVGSSGRSRPDADWQPIETAPKDAVILLYCPQGDGSPGSTFRVTVGNWFYHPGGTVEHRDLDGRYIGQDDSDEQEGWLSWDGGFSGETMMPTRWMPLPAPPVSP